ncbi:MULTISPECIES: DUF1515 family protein [unclassified Sinorhizobium]|uniref:DUF1515 family protein n=1 Tax=unclassified Sinorhizobium TaxID=2613772 RepID=UPI0035232C6A
MTSDYDASVHQQLGMLLAKVESLHEAIRRSEDQSDAGRASMHRRLDEMVDRVGKVETSVVTVQEEVREMKPVTDDVRRWKLMGMGALAVVGIGAAAFGVTFADALRRIVWVLIGKG